MCAPRKHCHGLLQPPRRGKHRTNVYSFAEVYGNKTRSPAVICKACRLIRDVWPSSARGNMSTGGPVRLAAGPTPCSRCFVNHSARDNGPKWKNLEGNESWEEFSAAFFFLRQRGNLEPTSQQSFCASRQTVDATALLCSPPLRA